MRNTPHLLYIFKLILFFVLWYLVYHLYIKDSVFNDSVTLFIGESTSVFYSFFDNNLDIIKEEYVSREANTLQETATIIKKKAVLIYLNKKPVLRIANACNGLDFMALFGIFILSFPVKFKEKIGVLMIGMTLIFILNVLRINALILNYVHLKSVFEFNHHITFNAIIYGALLYVWFRWAKGKISNDIEKS